MRIAYCPGADQNPFYERVLQGASARLREVTGVALWAVNSFIPMARPVKSILNIIVVVVLCIWLLQEFDVISGSMNLRMR